MSRNLSFDEIPDEVARFLRTALKDDKSIVFEDEGQPVAKMVKMAPSTGPQGSVGDLSYELPKDLLTAYHRLLDKKFTDGLTVTETAELKQLDEQLDKAESSTPLVQSIVTQATERDKRWMAILNDVIAKLRELRELT